MNSDLQKLTIHNALHRDLAPSEWRRTLRVTNTPDAISAKVQDINARLRLAAQHIPLDPQRLATGQKVQGAGLALLVVGVACWLSREFAHQLLDGLGGVVYDIGVFGALIIGSAMLYVGYRARHDDHLPGDLSGSDVDAAHKLLEGLQERERPIEGLWGPAIFFLLLALDIGVLMGLSMSALLPSQTPMVHLILASVIGLLMSKGLVFASNRLAYALRTSQLMMTRDHLSRGGAEARARGALIAETYAPVIPRFPVNPSWWQRNRVACGWFAVMLAVVGLLLGQRLYSFPDEWLVVAILGLVLAITILVAVQSSLASVVLIDKVRCAKAIARRFRDGDALTKYLSESRESLLATVRASAEQIRNKVLQPRFHDQSDTLHIDGLGELSVSESEPALRRPEVDTGAAAAPFRPAAPKHQAQHTNPAAKSLAPEPFRTIPKSAAR